MSVAYHIDHLEVINVNLTIRAFFPGKILMHIFVRKLSDQIGGTDTSDLVRLKNLDLCKILDSLRNVTVEAIQGESLLPSTFIISCPLVPGFYFVENSLIDSKLISFRIPDGRYMALIELIQVYEDVIKLASCRIKLVMKWPPGYKEPSIFDSSEEKEVDRKGNNKNPVEEPKEQTVEVTEPNQDYYTGSTDYN
ncbi:hypothetical protein KR009_003313 [Drosophila setifemur]|nr:hypothetical protein KR009_003313 [Drosophila setifemur]